MPGDWKEFLRARGATLAGGQVAHFGRAPEEPGRAAEGEVLAPLSRHAALAVEGQDAARFLHAQLTCDIHGLPAGESRLGAWCSPRGRVLAVLRVLRRESGFVLLLPRELLPGSLERLRMFVLRAAVRIEEDAARVLLGVAGERALARLAEALGPLPEAAGALRWQGDTALLRLPGTRARCAVLTAAGEAPRLWQHLAAEASGIGEPAWNLLEVRAGVPVVLPATADAFLPQMLNLDRLGGVSFTKGCYPGQEIVARTQHLGRLKRRMYRLRAPGAAPLPEPGAAVHAQGRAEPAGSILDAAPAPRGCEVLAVLGLDAAQGALRLGTGEEAPPLEIAPLPYAVTD